MTMDDLTAAAAMHLQRLHVSKRSAIPDATGPRHGGGVIAKFWLAVLRDYYGN